MKKEGGSLQVGFRLLVSRFSAECRIRWLQVNGHWIIVCKYCCSSDQSVAHLLPYSPSNKASSSSSSLTPLDPPGYIPALTGKVRSLAGYTATAHRSRFLVESRTRAIPTRPRSSSPPILTLYGSRKPGNWLWHQLRMFPCRVSRLALFAPSLADLRFAPLPRPDLPRFRFAMSTTAFMMYMTGGGVQIFSVMSVWFLLKQALSGLFGVSKGELFLLLSVFLLPFTTNPTPPQPSNPSHPPPPPPQAPPLAA